MNSSDLVRIIAIGLALVLVIANLKGRQIGLPDGLRMAALWGLLIVAAAIVFTSLGW